MEGINSYLLGLISPFWIKPIYKCIMSFIYLPGRFLSFEKVLLRINLDKDECEIIKYFKQREKDDCYLLTAMTGEELTPSAKTPNMGFTVYPKAAEQGLSFRKKLSNKQKEAIQKLINKSVLIDECPENPYGSYSHIQLNYSFRRKIKDVISIKLRSRNIELIKPKTLVIDNDSYCPMCKHLLNVKTYENGIDYRCHNPHKVGKHTYGDFFRIHNSENRWICVFHFENDIAYKICYNESSNISQLAISNLDGIATEVYVADVVGNYTGLSRRESVAMINLLYEQKYMENRIWNIKTWYEKNLMNIISFSALIIASIYVIYFQ